MTLGAVRATPSASTRQTARVPRSPAGYQIRHAQTRELLSRHRTRTAAVDNWRLHHTGKPVVIVRVFASGAEVVIVEGTWHVASTATGEAGPGTEA